MSLITDTEWTIQQIRSMYLKSDDPLAERIITFPNIDPTLRQQQQQQQSISGSLDSDSMEITLQNYSAAGDQNTSSVQQQQQQQQSLFFDYQNAYVTEDVKEKSMCYSPNIQHITSDVLKINKLRVGQHQSQQLQQSRVDQTQGVNTSKKDLRQQQQQQQQQQPAIALPQPPPIPDKASLEKLKSADSLNAIKAQLLEFTPVQVVPVQQTKSLLTAKVKSGAQNSNPFKDYSHICGRGDLAPVTLRIYFPSSAQATKASIIVVKRDASVEDVVGYALYCYVEEKRLPAIASSNSDGKQLVQFWNLRIVEDEGEVDEDFPALERNRKIQKFAFDQFAVCPSENMQQKLQKQRQEQQQQQQQQQSGQSSAFGPNVTGNDKRNAPAPVSGKTSLPPISASKSNNNNNSRPDQSLSMMDLNRNPNVRSSLLFIKVHLYSTLEVKQTTTVSVPADMLLGDVLAFCAKKRKIDPSDYTLKMADTKTDVPLDKTIGASGLTELCLLKKDRGPSAGDIFLRPPEEMEQDVDYDEPQYIPDEYTSVYKRYNVTRKMPMIMSKIERIMAIDGDYIYFMPPENRNFFDSVKTVSFHIANIVSCKQAKKSTTFKMVIVKDNGKQDTKTYEFDAQSPSEAQEICTKIHFMTQFYKIKK
ncbi:hypothetical protein MP228_010733 [Amoeboaphelidium protococcarum]|nr:hypothetical protein MP228_010733 [Amoeboaphelidium protococcarum]